MQTPLYIDPYAFAQTALMGYWACAFLAILGAGTALPLVIGRYWPQHHAQARQKCALLAVCLCIVSLLLVPDTVAVESRSPESITTLECSVAGPTLLWCSDGTEREAPAGAQARAGVWFQLYFSGLFVHYEPRG